MKCCMITTPPSNYYSSLKAEQVLNVIPICLCVALSYIEYTVVAQSDDHDMEHPILVCFLLFINVFIDIMQGGDLNICFDRMIYRIVIVFFWCEIWS